MSTSFHLLAIDLALWEDGLLEREQLERRHAAEDIPGMLALHERLAAVADEPVPAPRWEDVEARLAEAEAVRVVAWMRRKVLRPAVLAAAAVLLMGAIAYATVEPVREGIDRAWRAVVELFQPGEEGSGPLDLEGPSEASRPGGDQGRSAGADESSDGGNQEAQRVGPDGGQAGDGGGQPNQGGDGGGGIGGDHDDDDEADKGDDDEGQDDDSSGPGGGDDDDDDGDNSGPGDGDGDDDNSGPGSGDDDDDPLDDVDDVDDLDDLDDILDGGDGGDDRDEP
jgi:hypothetical protein